MIAVHIGPDMRMAVVGAPSCFATRPQPRKPQDLTAHNCINIHLPTYGGFYTWEFEKNGRKLKVRFEGQLVFNNIALRLNAALAGFGLAYLPEDQVQTHLGDGRLIRVLADWCPSFSGYHLYYPSRRQLAPAFALLVDALRYRVLNQRHPGVHIPPSWMWPSARDAKRSEVPQENVGAGCRQPDRPCGPPSPSQDRTCRFPAYTAQASASTFEGDRWDRLGRHQRWKRARVRSPMAGSRRTTILVLPPCSGFGSKAARRPRTPESARTLENLRFSTKSSDNMFF